MFQITPFADKENEANLLKACCHPNIVKFYKVNISTLSQVLVAKNYLYLIMERLVG